MLTTALIDKIRINRLFYFLKTAIVLAAFQIGESKAGSTYQCMITQEGITPIRLGMTLKEAKGVFPSAKFERASDGDGSALISVTLGKEELMVLYANEDDSELPIDWSRTITHAETFNPRCKTDADVNPGMPVKNVEKKFGRTKEITLSEIESREYIEFASQPAYLLFRLDYSGIFAPGSNRTVKFGPDAKISSIAVTKD